MKTREAWHRRECYAFVTPGREGTGSTPLLRSIRPATGPPYRPDVIITDYWGRDTDWIQQYAPRLASSLW
jgi:hypothetical protein